MLKVFLSSHGTMASGIRKSLSILMGECENLTVFDAYIDETSVQQHLDDFYKTVGAEDEVLLCSDLYGGSVNQVMCTYLDRPNTRLVAGVNLIFMMDVLGETSISDTRLDEIIDESREFLRRVDLTKLDTQPSADAEGDFF